MKKLVVLLATVAVAALGACTPSDSTTSDPTTPQSTPSDPVAPQSATPEPTPSTVPVDLYLPNSNADGWVTKPSTTDGSAQHIVSLLVAEGALPEGCAVLSFEPSSTTISVDMNDAFFQAINNTGTTGERLQMGSLVNTLLTFYGAQEITVTVDGGSFSSGHTVYDSPQRFYEY